MVSLGNIDQYIDRPPKKSEFSKTADSLTAVLDKIGGLGSKLYDLGFQLDSAAVTIPPLINPSSKLTPKPHL